MTPTARKCLQDIAKLEAMIAAVSQRCVLQREALGAWVGPRRPKFGPRWDYSSGKELEKRLAAVTSDEIVLAGLADELRATIGLYYAERRKPIPPGIKKQLLATEFAATNLRKTATRKGR